MTDASDAGLGDFSTIFSAFSTRISPAPPFDVPDLTDGPSSTESSKQVDNAAYVSDGVAYQPGDSILVEPSSDADTSSDGGTIKTSAPKSKDSLTRARKLPRLEKKQAKKAKRPAKAAITRKAISDIENDRKPPPPKQHSPATKASTHSRPATRSQTRVTVQPNGSPTPLPQPYKSPKPAAQAVSISSSATVIAPRPRSVSFSHPSDQQKPSFSTRSAFKAPRYELNLEFRRLLVQNFPNERDYITRLVPPVNHNVSTGAIHVFIDYSNVWIGYMNAFKLSRGMNLKAYIGPEDRNLDFEALAFFLERGRPVARRILVGSEPHIPSFDVAKHLAYETNILAKVKKAPTPHKGPNLTSYDIFNRITPNGSIPGIIATYGQPLVVPSAAPANTPLAEKWVEQGVDELLQMKMMESIIDSQVPSTFVLATGDGAVAEYSEGFLKVVDRALRCGWKVELVSWSQSLNAAYLRAEWLAKYPQGHFVINFLDPWLPFLTGD